MPFIKDPREAMPRSAHASEEGGRKKSLLDEQPGPEVRQAGKDEETRRHDDEDHAFTTDSPRWNEPGSSEDERGYPPEGGKPA